MSSIATANDSSNVLFGTATQPLSVPFQENASALLSLLQDLQSKVARIARAVERKPCLVIEREANLLHARGSLLCWTQDRLSWSSHS